MTTDKDQKNKDQEIANKLYERIEANPKCYKRFLKEQAEEKLAKFEKDSSGKKPGLIMDQFDMDRVATGLMDAKEGFSRGGS